MSSSHTMSSRHWEAEVENGDLDIDEDLELPKSAVTPSNLCQQFSSELKKKFQVGHTHTQHTFKSSTEQENTDIVHDVIPVLMCFVLGIFSQHPMST